MPWDDGVDWYPTGGTDNDVWDPTNDDDGNPMPSNETDPYESGYLNGDADGSDNSPTNPSSPNFDWASLGKLFGGAAGAAAGGAGGSGGSGGLTDLLKGLLGNGSGSLGLTDLLSILGLLGTGAYSMNQRNDAAAGIKQAGDESNARIQGVLDRANANYEPYNAAGIAALQKWAAMPPQNLADQFHAQGTKSDLAGKFARPLSSLAKG